MGRDAQRSTVAAPPFSPRGRWLPSWRSLGVTGLSEPGYNGDDGWGVVMQRRWRATEARGGGALGDNRTIPKGGRFRATFVKRTPRKTGA